MRHNFPPLNALKVFEVAARHLSFSKAAEELFVTQGAVSKQIQTLEQYLEQPLFHREKGGLKLTEAGKRYLPAVADALDNIQNATALLKQNVSDSSSLLLKTSPSFSALWMIPHLHEIKAEFEDLTLQVTSTDTGNIFSTDADILIHCHPISSNLDPDTLLVEEKLVAAISPERLSLNPINTANDLLKHPLILHTTRPQLWTSFLNHYLNNDYPTPKFSDGFEHFFMSMEAVKQGQGIGLLPSFMAKEALLNVELENPLNIEFMSGYGYYYSVPNHKRNNRRVLNLMRWVQEKISQ